MLNNRSVTKQDYLYFKSSYGLMGIGKNTEYEIGAINNNQKHKDKLGEVGMSSEYNKLDDSVYVMHTTGCVVSVLSRDGRKGELNYCTIKHKGNQYEATSIFFDKKNYKYVILNGGFGRDGKYVNAIAIYNAKRELVKVINSDLYIQSLVILEDKILYPQFKIVDMDGSNTKYLTTYDLKTNKSMTIDYSKKYKHLYSIGALMQLDNDYLIAYRGDDDYNYVVMSSGKIINKSKNLISNVDPSHQIDGKWYLDVTVSQGSYDGGEGLVEYTKDSYRIINYSKVCDRYNSLMFNNKSVYCIDKKDNKKIISVLGNDKNVYMLDKKYEYGSYHGLVLFGFK